MKGRRRSASWWRTLQWAGIPPWSRSEVYSLMPFFSAWTGRRGSCSAGSSERIDVCCCSSGLYWLLRIRSSNLKIREACNRWNTHLLTEVPAYTSSNCNCCCPKDCCSSDWSSLKMDGTERMRRNYRVGGNWVLVFNIS